MRLATAKAKESAAALILRAANAIAGGHGADDGEAIDAALEVLADALEHQHCKAPECAVCAAR